MERARSQVLRNRTFRLALASVVALVAGVGVALAAAGPQPVLFDLTIAGHGTVTQSLGYVPQDAANGTKPLSGTVTWGDGSTSTQRIACPVDGQDVCDLRATKAYTLPDGVEQMTWTVTNEVVSTSPDGIVTGTETTTATMRGRASGNVRDFAEAFDLGSARIGESGAVVPVTIVNADEATGSLTIEDFVLAGDHRDVAVVGHDCTDVAPGGTCDVRVALRPTRAGSLSADITLRLDNTPNAVEFTAFGTGLPAAAVPPVVVDRPVPGPAITIQGAARTITINGSPRAAACVVPALKGKSLSAARTALKAAKCRLGTVDRPKRARGTLVVASQTVRAGTRRSADAKVGVRLARKRVTRRG